MNERILYCGDADCEGVGQCPCGVKSKDQVLEKAYWEYHHLANNLPPYKGKMESGHERLAFKAIVSNLLP